MSLLGTSFHLFFIISAVSFEFSVKFREKDYYRVLPLNYCLTAVTILPLDATNTLSDHEN
jgi:hypothetical protein